MQIKFSKAIQGQKISYYQKYNLETDFLNKAIDYFSADYEIDPTIHFHKNSQT